MNKSLFLAALCVCVAMTMASQCSSQCNGVCALAKTDCDGAAVLGPVCDLALGQCAAGCGLICACPDACDGQCKPVYDTCASDAAGNVVMQLQCSAGYDACIAQCEGQCNVQIALDTVGGVLNPGRK